MSKPITEFLKNPKNFKGTIIVDNDCVYAYEDDEQVRDFDDMNPDELLILVLRMMGFKAEKP